MVVLKAAVLQQFDGERWQNIGMVEAAADGAFVVDDTTKHVADREFYNPQEDRLVTAAEPELFIKTLVENVGNAYFRWVEVDNP